KYAIAPRYELKEKIMKTILAKTGETKIVSLTAKTADHEQAVTQQVVREISSSQSMLSKLLIAASIALIVALSGIAFYFNHQFMHSQEQLAQLEEQESGILKQVDVLQLALKQNTEKVQMLTDANTTRVMMKGTVKSPASVVLVYWNKESKVVFMDIKTLPPAAADKQYQLWFIDPEAGPVSAGVFDVKTGEMMKMTNATNAAAFAVTLEPRGGSDHPTMDQMYVIGTVAS
ncbi:MAG: anti-sigma factor, partial [Chitinophagales bacterium]